MDDAAEEETVEVVPLLGQSGEAEEEWCRRRHLKIHTRRWRLEMKDSCYAPCAGKSDRMVFSYPSLSIFIPT